MVGYLFTKKRRDIRCPRFVKLFMGGCCINEAGIPYDIKILDSHPVGVFDKALLKARKNLGTRIFSMASPR